MRDVLLRLLLFVGPGVLIGCSAAEPEGDPPPLPPPPEQSTEAFLDEVQARTFAWFWETTDPAKGLVPDRTPSPPFSSVAAVGFGLTALPVGVERGFVTRAEAAERVLATLAFFEAAPQGSAPAGVTGHRGFLYHFLDLGTGERFGSVELSTIDTALFVAGALFCAGYFDRDDDVERRIRALADALYRRIEWDWFQPRPPALALAWTPEDGFSPYDYRGYNEAMILYLLALGSPTHPVAPEAWEAFTSTYRWTSYYGYDHLNFSPLFGHQYTHVWVDFRGIQDAFMRRVGIDYFENSRRATLAQRAYAIDNPRGYRGYGENLWGLTASDGPLDATLRAGGREVPFHTYWARGASADYVNDDGTIAPTAAGGSVPFAPEVAIPALRAMRDGFRLYLYGDYGFRDAFNLTFALADAEPQSGRVVPGVGWFASDRLGIDQGPILIMIENHRSGLVWDVMRENPYVVRGLCRAGFDGGWLAGRCDEPAGAAPPDG